MGHQRLGSIPKSGKWDAVVAHLVDGSGVACEDIGEIAALTVDADGRYRKAGNLLGGLPSFLQDELAEIDACVRDLTTNQQKARITGTEIDAALSDPRWRADVSSHKREA